MRKKSIWGTLAVMGAAACLAAVYTGNGLRLELSSYARERAEKELEAAGEYMVSGPEECRKLLMELASAGAGQERREFLVTGENYEPESLVIAQMFPDICNISNTKVREYTEKGVTYTTCRIGFERRPAPGDCSHQWESRILEKGNCLWGGEEELLCRLCGLRKIRSPAALGHVDKDRDQLCDRCGDRMDKEGQIETRFWSVGDIQTRKLGKNTYQFRCVDDDYGSGNSDYQKCALFLCETVIRSDVDSTDSQKTILTFGRDNNYKNSLVRGWLQEQCEGKAGEQMGAEALIPVNVGVNSAFLGQTKPGTYGETAERELVKTKLLPQLMSDRLFLLSVEEAVKYREELWTVSGEEGPYSRGYWLRTPVYQTGEKGDFSYGTEIYAVDLSSGSIRPAEVSDGSYGLRPAYCLPQP